ncbi:VTT domain-containing protein [Candidatus Parcubacteria bacterium]|nr:VTT domain-containing protein [Patescibacteria group bacterium]MBU4309946.1 VTT domain-containing protein [Patescibacteria group bacterium]MBU4432256.1 VTT domain-containing protein [Patescibacteria group bacterium]MBU4577871.1 VTT domain-containing protein [Patescibacteria group bacterium]MCG2696932.1 VTT domain-containing protein [Candidatus Parcubacteria bacterium]
MSIFKHKAIKKVLALTFFLFLMVSIFGALYYFRETVYSSVDQLAFFIKEHIFVGILAFVLISILAVVFSPLSSLPLVPSAIIAWGDFWTFVFLLSGWFIGSLVGYFLGYFTREGVLEKFFSLKKIEYYKSQISQDAQFLLVLIFRLAIPSEITAYTLGIVRYDLKKFMIIAVLSELPFALLVVYSGRAVYDGNIFLFIGIITFALVFITFFSLLLKKRFK